MIVKETLKGKNLFEESHNSTFSNAFIPVLKMKYLKLV